MSLHQLPAGIHPPEDIFVIVEIPAFQTQIKYEIDKTTGALLVDRFLTMPMCYPCNYGYINQTLALDGDPIDVLVPTPCPLQAGAVLRCRPVGILNMSDEAGHDAKVLAVPHEKVSGLYTHIQTFTDFPASFLDQISAFFKHYKALDKGKWVKVEGWQDKMHAYQAIQTAAEKFQCIQGR